MGDIDISKIATDCLVNNLMGKAPNNLVRDIGDAFSALHNALDAAEARAVGVKPLVWDASTCGTFKVANSPLGEFGVEEDDGWHCSIDGHADDWVRYPYAADSTDTHGFDTEALAMAECQRHHNDTLTPWITPASPLGAVAMREKAAASVQLCADYVEEPFSAEQLDELAMEIHDIPPTFTPAELLAAATELPEVKALVDAAQGQIKLHRVLRPHGIAAEKTDADLRAALAPFARKGE